MQSFVQAYKMHALGMKKLAKNLWAECMDKYTDCIDNAEVIG